MERLRLNRVRFTDEADEVISNHGILNPEDSIVNTLEGADEIIGTNSVSGDFGFGVLVDATTINLGSVIASAEFSGRARVAANGIRNRGTINTNQGRDVVRGSADAKLSATAATVSQAIALAETEDASVITNAFASIQFRATADGIDNRDGELNTNRGGGHG